MVQGIQGPRSSGETSASIPSIGMPPVQPPAIKPPIGIAFGKIEGPTESPQSNMIPFAMQPPAAPSQQINTLAKAKPQSWLD